MFAIDVKPDGSRLIWMKTIVSQSTKHRHKLTATQYMRTQDSQTRVFRRSGRLWLFHTRESSWPTVICS